MFQNIDTFTKSEKKKEQVCVQFGAPFPIGQEIECLPYAGFFDHMDIIKTTLRQGRHNSTKLTLETVILGMVPGGREEAGLLGGEN